MARFILLPKDGTVVVVNADHVHAVTYTPTEGTQRVNLMGKIELLKVETGADIYAHALIEFAEFETEEDAKGFIEKNFILFNN